MDITCRTWVLKILYLLQKPENGSILKCDDLGALEAEIKDWGNEFAPGAAQNVQPRQIGYSKICML
jgi:hypothetical protein